jgi:hypothetical protein
MIKTNIGREYPSHLTGYTSTNQSLYVADYTNQTASVRGTELFTGSPPADIDYFSLRNNGLTITGIIFDNQSFTRPDRSTRSQCECVVFPDISDNHSWIFFAELKYSCLAYNNENNLNKARRQLFKTQYYYKSRGIFSITNTCYLFASLPEQSEPFANFPLNPSYLLDMKERHNIVIRFQNSAEIINAKQINV